jgi:hypothetical protein
MDYVPIKFNNLIETKHHISDTDKQPYIEKFYNCDQHISGYVKTIKRSIIFKCVNGGGSIFSKVSWTITFENNNYCTIMEYDVIDEPNKHDHLIDQNIEISLHILSYSNESHQFDDLSIHVFNNNICIDIFPNVGYKIEDIDVCVGLGG